MFSENEFHIVSKTPENLREAWDIMNAEGVRADFIVFEKFEDFLKKMLDTGSVYLVRYRKRIAALFMFDHFEADRCARIHFVTFHSGRFIMLHGLRLVFDFAFTRFDTLICWTPTSNNRACKFTKSLGAKVLGIIPNAIQTAAGLEAVQVAYLTKENFNYGRRRRITRRINTGIPGPLTNDD